MVWFLPVTRLMGEGKQMGRGWVLFTFLTCLPIKYSCQEEKIHLAQGAAKMRKKSEKWPLWSCPTPTPFSPPLQTEARTPPHLTSAWSLGKQMELGEEHKAGTIEVSLPVYLTSNSKTNLNTRGILPWGKQPPPHSNSSKCLTNTKFVTEQLFR